MAEALKFSAQDKPARGHASRPLITAEDHSLVDVDADQIIALRAELACQERRERERARWKVHLAMLSGSIASGARLSRFQPMARR